MLLRVSPDRPVNLRTDFTLSAFKYEATDLVGGDGINHPLYCRLVHTPGRRRDVYIRKVSKAPVILRLEACVNHKTRTIKQPHMYNIYKLKRLTIDLNSQTRCIGTVQLIATVNYTDSEGR